MIFSTVLLLILSAKVIKGSYPIGYFETLRESNSAATKSTQNERLFAVTDVNGDTFQLAQITTFLPFTDGNSIFETAKDDLAASLMAIYHFNNPELSPHLSPQELEGCNIKFTAEFFDTGFSPIDSTRLFTNILQRQHTLQNPLPSGVIGAFRSAVTSPLAILTGVNDIPQISYASSSTDFDVKEQYPLFGRTIQSSTGEAQVALELFKSLNASHVGVLFVTDAFGSALQKAFQDAASEQNIITDSVAFSYSPDPNGTEISNAVQSLKQTEYRLFYVVAFETHYKPIMQAAFEQELIGNDFLWIFNGLDLNEFHRNAVFEPESDLVSATTGVGLITAEGGLRTETKRHGVPFEPPLEEDPQTSHEKFRSVWRNTISDPDINAYFYDRIPATVRDRPDFDPNFRFSLEPVSYTPFLYDAITAMGISYCRAARQGTFDGSNVFSEFSNLDFDGATGRVRISNQTGTRDYTTEIFKLHNVRPAAELKEGKVVFDLVPTSFYQNEWKNVPTTGQEFIYAGGSTSVPKSLPPPEKNLNFIGFTGRAVGYTLMGIVIVGSLVGFVWLLLFRNERVVRSSQPLFLSMIALSALVMASSIIPLSLEEPVSQMGLNISCMFAPWLYLTGAVIALASLLAKTRGVHQAYTNPDLDFIHVTSFDIIGTFSLLYLVNAIIMIAWTFAAPLRWRRVDLDSTDTFGRSVESYGTCSNADSLPFAVVILIFNILALIVANWWAYQARNIETEYHESRYIGISMASILQAWCMGIPILIVVWDNPQAKFFVEAGIVFVTALAVLLLIFIPKMMAIRTDRNKAAEENKRLAFNNFTSRTKRHSYGADDTDSKRDPSTGNRESTTNKTGEESSDGSAVKGESSEPSQPFASNVPKTSVELEQESGKSTGSGSRAFRIVTKFRKTTTKDGSQGGIRVMHNPKSARNLKLNGRQWEKTKQDAKFEMYDDSSGKD